MKNIRKANCLLLPLSAAEGYPQELVVMQLKTVTAFLTSAGVNVETSEMICTDTDAQMASYRYNPAQFDFSVIFVATWCKPTLALRAAKNILNKPVIIWCVGSFSYCDRQVEMSSTPAAMVLKGIFMETGVKYDIIYALPDALNEGDILTNIRRFSNAARAISLLDAAKYAHIGYYFNDNLTSDIDFTLSRWKFGTEIVSLDTYEYINDVESISVTSPEYIESAEKIKELAGDACGNITRMSKMLAVLRKYVKIYELDGINVRCNMELSGTYGQTACIPLSVLGNDIICSCESDVPVMLTQFIFHFLSGGRPSTYADIRAIDESGITAGACGFSPSSMCVGDKITCDCLRDETGDASGYVSNGSMMKSGTVSIGRLLKNSDHTFSMHFSRGVAEGEAEHVVEMGCPLYPIVKIVPECGIEHFTKCIGANHYAIVYDDILEDIRLFCKYAGIKMIE